MSNIRLTETGVRCLEDIESFNALRLSPQKAIKITESLLRESITAISDDPKRYRFNASLLDLGLFVRERLDIDRGYRVLYEIKDDLIYILLFLSTKQDLTDALYRHQILRSLQ
ncbi:type II toxin-antitoxin system RelE/ParE family toxin [Xenorhabdus bovienii]|uniref:Type II toxin-antitoxin system RelE/ParE family toxin n=1 Tax=Xenorhabdus bovienii str. kraussei Becker Underwood TaxID=1398204 RepID=A0A077PS06_XENBV|nr:type II toxin-antitoxin system RelE/ParE family toxin [Xenorhabdus bovienii]CDH23526.1 conserved hypothetical protein [Xenorhabdus bovienii str. kraussei Becker Underwood]